MDGENWGGAREQFWTIVFFCCELQISICLMPSISATSDTAILPSAWMRTLARSTWSWLRDTDKRPDRASSDTPVLPYLNVSTHSKTFLWLILATDQLNAQIIVYNKFIIFLYMFRALLCSSPGGQIVLYNTWYRHTLQVAVMQCRQNIKGFSDCTIITSAMILQWISASLIPSTQRNLITHVAQGWCNVKA